MRIPAPDAQTVEIRIASLQDRDRFGERWSYAPLARTENGFWEIDAAALGLPDGCYEYEFVIDGERSRPVADPYAREITRFGGYRGLLRIANGIAGMPPFDWSDDLPQGMQLPENNRIVIYEMPLRWMEGDMARQVGLGTFDKAIFAHLDRLAATGINCIELLPVQDSPDTLNWGYGTRFFFAPDFDMGAPVDLKLFVKRCHQRGIRVILDVVMNHARECPLARLAWDRHFIHRSQEPGRGEDYGGQMFRYREPVDGRHWAREFHFDAARDWIEQYRIDGFRIDEFKGIDNWEFVQQFRDHAWRVFRERFPDRPFIVIAEDSWTRSIAVRDGGGNPNGRKVVDAIWNFGYRDDLRRLLLNDIRTEYGEPSRRERIVALVSGRAKWDDWSRRFDGGFGDLAAAVIYLTSHDVEKDGERRFMNHVLSSLLRWFGKGDGSFAQVRDLANALRGGSPEIGNDLRELYRQALARVRSAHALLTTSVGMPMLLAGEEFADIHDTNHHDWQLKMSDPVDWDRREHEGHKQVAAAVADLIWLRGGQPALHRNEVEFFHFHPAMDENAGPRVFAYCRSAGLPLGAGGQVVVVANMGGDDFPVYEVPWPWKNGWSERGAAPGAAPPMRVDGSRAALSLHAFEVRVFETY
jgi:1,4-alpha-glucan branching enzyme